MGQTIANRTKSTFENDNSKSTESENTKEQNPQLITELILDGRKLRSVEPNDKSLLEEFTNLTKLSCNRTSLNSLTGIPYIPSLNVFEATDNYISGGLQNISQQFPNLICLELGGNLITSFDELLFLQKLTKLESLGLEINPIADQPNYRSTVFQILPQIKILDGMDANGNEMEFVDDEDMSDYNSEEDITLKDFYKKDFNDQDDFKDEDFEPGNMDEGDEDFSSEENYSSDESEDYEEDDEDERQHKT